jgi:hypothetical protein
LFVSPHPNFQLQEIETRILEFYVCSFQHARGSASLTRALITPALIPRILHTPRHLGNPALRLFGQHLPSQLTTFRVMEAQQGRQGCSQELNFLLPFLALDQQTRLDIKSKLKLDHALLQSIQRGIPCE